MTTYTMSVTLDVPYDEALSTTRDALADAGFGVLTEIDVRETMKNKLSIDVPAQIILGACRPQLAHQAMSVDPSVAALLPCNVVVRALDDHHTLVETVDPDAMLGVADPGLADVASEARVRLTTALCAMGDADIPPRTLDHSTTPSTTPSGQLG